MSEMDSEISAGPRGSCSLGSDWLGAAQQLISTSTDMITRMSALEVFHFFICSSLVTRSIHCPCFLLYCDFDFFAHTQQLLDVFHSGMGRVRSPNN